jgi:hypothetical protein
MAASQGERSSVVVFVGLLQPIADGLNNRQRTCLNQHI